jgi:hypothetical protein
MKEKNKHILIFHIEQLQMNVTKQCNKNCENVMEKKLNSMLNHNKLSTIHIKMPLNIENNRKKQGKYNQKGTP